MGDAGTGNVLARRGKRKDAATQLELEDAAHRGVKALVGDVLVGLEGAHQLFQLADVVVAPHLHGHERDVRTGKEGPAHGVDRREIGRDGVHVEGVGDGDARESQLVAQDVGEEGLRERGRQGHLAHVGVGGGGGLGLYLRVLDVGGHHHINARLEGGAERHELELLELGQALVDARQTGVGVRRRVAMAGEVLGAAADALALDSLEHRAAQLAHELGPVGERAQADDGVVRVVVDVHHRGKVDVDAKGAQLISHDLAALARKVGAARGAEGHVARHGATAAQAVDDAALLVDAEQKRDAAGRRPRGVAHRSRLQGIGELEGLLRLVDVVGKEDDATKAVLVDDGIYLVVHLNEVSRIFGRAIGVPHAEVGHEHLADLLAASHRLEQHGDVLVLDGTGHVGGGLGFVSCARRRTARKPQHGRQCDGPGTRRRTNKRPARDPAYRHASTIRLRQHAHGHPFRPQQAAIFPNYDTRCSLTPPTINPNSLVQLVSFRVSLNLVK